MADSQKTVLFADITDSTKLYEKLGDAEARRLTAACMEKMIHFTENAEGKVIKTMGDGLMALFPNPNKAYLAAVDMQEASRDGDVSITVGFHAGPVLEESGDIFGDTVNLAARVAAKAKAGEILLTKETVEFLSPPFNMTVRLLDKTQVKGKAEPVEIYTVLMDSDDEATISLSSSPFMKADFSQQQGPVLTIKAGDAEAVLKIGGRSLTLGRSADCSLAVPDAPYASRKHASIALQRDKFMLTDQSTNGTYIQTDGGKPVFVKRESVQLTGKGIIMLGEQPDAEASSALRFEIS